MLTACSLFDHPELAKLDVYTINSVKYTTADGVWYSDNVDDMIDLYYDEKKRSVDIDIEITFTVDADFQYAEISCIGGVDTSFAAVGVYTTCNHSTKLGSENIKDGLVKAGTYTVQFDNAEFGFYSIYKGDSAYASDAPIDRSRIDMSVELVVYKYYGG